jgi:hypothetical protein
MNFEEKLNKIKEDTAKDMEKHILSYTYLIKESLLLMEREEALKQIENFMRMTADMARSYAVLNAVVNRLGHE